jgi:3-deoxy-D-manno-octulosonic-acid transferase
MYFFYALLTNLAVIISPLIFIYRILKGKEDPKRLKRKFVYILKKELKIKFGYMLQVLVN